MKKVSTFFKALLLLFIVSLSVLSCSKDSDDAGSGSTPSNGWRLGATNYTTAFTLRGAAGSNTIGALDALPTPSNTINRFIVLFNNTTGIAAGTYKIVLKANQSDLLADEIIVSPGTGFSSSSSGGVEYVTVAGQTVSATVTVTGGKAKIVVPTINVISVPITASSTTTTFSGTLVEQ